MQSDFQTSLCETNRSTWRLVWILFALFSLRLVTNDFILEPTNDEGLWVWNARCDYWGLPDFGVLQIALSPLSYFLDWTVFALTSPSILASRITNSTLILSGLGIYLHFLRKHGREAANPWLLVWLLLDPSLFRMGSWAVLEPRLCFLVIILYVTHHSAHPHRAVLEGFLVGALVSIKLTVLWLYVGIAAVYCFRREWSSIIRMTLAFTVTTAVLYGSIYTIFGHRRFFEIWEFHTAGRFSPGRGLWGEIVSWDPRSYYYLFTILGVLAAAVWYRYRLAVVVPILVGVLFVLAQGELPARYVFPLALWTFLTFVNYHASLLAALSRHWLKGMLLLVLGANVVYAEVFIYKAQNAGGKYMMTQIEAAVAHRRTVAAPPNLSVGFNYPIEPTSIGPLTDYSPPLKYAPQLYIRQSIAAQPSLTDLIYEPIFKAKRIAPRELGFYRIYRMADVGTGAPDVMRVD